MTDRIINEYGFTFGAAEVTRMAELPDGAVCIRIKARGGKHVDVYVSAAGRSMRIFSGDIEMATAQ